MSVVVVGLNHRHAALDQLERLAVSREQAPKALQSLTERPHVAEAVVLSTCNRVEVYARVHRYHGGVGDLRSFLCEWGGFAPEELVDLTYEFHDEGAASHLFSVACGLDSVVVGEPQVARQVKQAFLTAREEQACGSQLGVVFERALRVARQVRTTTQLDHAASSMLDAGLTAARSHLGSLAGRSVLLVGAGKIGSMAARRLADEAGALTVVNRTAERATRLAELSGATALPFGQLGSALADADLVVTSTAAKDPVVTPELLAPATAVRAGRPLVLVDLAVPRDVATTCRDVDGVVVLDVDAVAATVATRPAGDELERARELVSREVAALQAWLHARPAEPTIAALRRRAEGVRAAELERFAPKLVDLEPRERATVEQITRSIVNTLLHEPTVRLKAASAREEGRWSAQVLRELFDLDDPDGD